jgi:two-component system, NtrC family, response regulator HydG
MSGPQPWVSCYLTDLLLTYLERHHPAARIDYPALLQGVEGFEPSVDPPGVLRDVRSWVPLGVLRGLIAQAERITGRKDVAYHAARDYFEHDRGDLLSLFEIIFRVQDDIRSVVISSHLWAGVHTNYLRLQSFETPTPERTLFMLAQFPEAVRPTIASMHLVRGIAEGFPRLYSFCEDLRCVEEISQLRIEDIAREFPDARVRVQGETLGVYRGGSDQPVVEARRLPLRAMTIPPPAEALPETRDAVVPPLRSGALRVLTAEEETDPREIARAPVAYRIVRAGTLGEGGLACTLAEGQIYNAPYSRFRVVWSETARPQADPPVEQVRRQASELLFAYLQQVRETQTRMAEYSIERSRLLMENSRLRREAEREGGFAGILGQSKPMRELFGLIRSVAQTDVSVLIQGETGTGKELIARAIHATSPRGARRFVAVNCGALAETLLQSELFGHERGAFTGAEARRKGIFEVADGGTLFLDEIGEISPATQVKLLRVLQDGEFQRVGGTETIRVSVRVLSATNQELAAMVEAGKFRQDLYYRLNVFPVRALPLRERAEDIPLLISHFLETAARTIRKLVRGVSPEALSLLMAYRWPGNVRELENAIQRMVVVARGEILTVEELPQEIRGARAETGRPAGGLAGLARASVALVEQQTILDALAETGRNITRAAKLLGVSRATLQTKMKSYGLRGPKSQRTP